MSETVYLNYIGGEWVASEGGETMSVRDPATGEVLHAVQASTPADVDRAVAAAREAFETTDWKDNAERRAAALHKLAQKLAERQDHFRDFLIREAGKIFPVARSEAAMIVKTTEYYADLTRWVYGRTAQPTPNSISILVREPVGVVGIITPWNMPLALLLRPLAPALAAGCAVVLKPAEQTSGVTAELVKVIEEIEEIPPGIVNLVTGAGETVGAHLAGHEDVDMISFTGGTDTGREIVRLSANNLKKVSLELGGKSPNIIFADADFEAAVKGALAGAAFWNAGQVCTAGTRLLVEESVHDQFVERIREAVSKLKVGPGTQRVHVGPVVSEEQLNRVLHYIEVGKQVAKLVVGGRRLTEGELAKGYFVEPTVFDRPPLDSPIAQDEIFGPVVTVIPFKDVDEAVQIANTTRYGLVAAVWTKDINKAFSVAKRVRAGTVWINSYGNLFQNVEFGGVRQSGYSRHYGLEGLLEYTELKHIYVPFSNQ